MKTIKQIADDLGISKQAVHKKITGKLKDSIEEYLHVTGGTVYIDERGEAIIKADRLAQQPPTTDNQQQSIATNQQPTTDNQQQSIADQDNGTAQQQTNQQPSTTDKQQQSIADNHNGIVAAQQLHIESLTRELESKTAQLESLSNTVKELTKLLDQSQQLQLGITNDLHDTIKLWTNSKKRRPWLSWGGKTD